MKISVRCSEVSVLPSDASGFFVTVEVCDVDKLLHDIIMELDESRLRALLGDEQMASLAKRGREIVKRALASAPAEREEPHG